MAAARWAAGGGLPGLWGDIRRGVHMCTKGQVIGVVGEGVCTFIFREGRWTGCAGGGCCGGGDGVRRSGAPPAFQVRGPEVARMELRASRWRNSVTPFAIRTCGCG